MTHESARGLTRLELYEAAWEEPLSRLGPRCGLTDVGLAKLCRRLNVPIPGRGYWRKLETGKKVPKRPPLPTNRAQSTDTIVVSMGSALHASPMERVVVTPVLDVRSLHPVAATALERLQAAKPDRKDDILSPGCLGIRILPEAIDRTILIIDALAKEFDQRKCELGTDAQGHAIVSSDCDKVSFQILQDPITGRLSLLRDSGYRGRKTWSDGAKTRVERQLKTFIASVEIRLTEIREARIGREREEAFQARLQKRKMERKRKAEEERATAKWIWRTMASWEKANRLRIFATAADAASRDGQPDMELASEMANAARVVADRLDPLLPEKPPELATIDYIKFEEWYTRTLALLGKEDGYKRYGAQRVSELRMTPEEAASEINWEAFWM